MPRPRFATLDPTRRRAILDAAAAEFVFTRDTPETELAPKQTAVVGGTATLVLL